MTGLYPVHIQLIVFQLYYYRPLIMYMKMQSISAHFPVDFL